MEIKYYKDGYNLASNYIKVFDIYNGYEYLEVKELEELCSYIKQLNYFKNKNKTFNKQLAHNFIKTYRYDLLKHNKFFIECVKLVIPKYIKMLKNEFPALIKYREGVIESLKEDIEVRDQKYLAKNLQGQIKIKERMDEFYKNFDDMTLNAIRKLFSSKGVNYLFNEVFYESMFENITYLLNSSFVDKNSIFKSMPEEVKGFMKEHIQGLSNSSSFICGNNFLERLINREIYKNKINETQIFCLLEFVKEVNNQLYHDIIVSNDFIKLELTTYEMFANQIVTKEALERMCVTINKMKSPKPHMKKIADEKKEIIAKMKSFEFSSVNNTMKLSLSIPVGRNELLKHEDLSSLRGLFDFFNKQKSTKAGFLKINLGGRTNLAEVIIEYKEEDVRNMGENYFQDMIKRILIGKENISFDKYKSIYDDLLNFRLNYLLNLNTNKSENSLERKKKKI